MGFEEVECEEVNWLHLAQDRGSVVGSYEHGNYGLGYVGGEDVT
jgi:hypothetical protein